jgi:hypothetical protein
MKVCGIENLTLGELIEQVKQGGRFVLFHWSVGLGVRSVHLPSAVRFVRPGEAAGRGICRTLATLATGWWAFPHGPKVTIATARENLRGGRDVTAAVLRRIADAERLASTAPTGHLPPTIRPLPNPFASHAA